MSEVISDEDRALVGELYNDARRFAAVVAPWDMDPDDVLHGALVGVMRSGRLAGVQNPAAYLRRAIFNEVAGAIRRKRRQRGLLGRIRVAESNEANQAFPSDLADLMSLRPIERAVLYLHDIEGIPFEEVAEAVGINAGNARVTASRARGRLRLLLTEESAR